MSMNIDYTNKVVLITGGNAGIGYACAQLFLELGASVAICGTSEEKLSAAVNELKKVSDKIYGEVCDVADPKSLRAFADHTKETFGDIDVWMSNAGICPQYDIIDTPDDVFDTAFDVNVKAVHVGAKIAYEMMKDRGGVMLLASSFASIMPSVGSGIYAATKSAVSSMVKTLAAELAPYNIRVNGYIPGVIDTAMSRLATSKNGEAMAKVISMQKFGDPVEIAYGAAFLASEYAGYITGICLEISGGKFSVQNPAAAWDKKLIREG